MKSSLEFKHFCIHSSLFHEHFMVSSFSYFSIPNHNNLIRLFYCLKSVSNYHYRSFFKQSVHGNGYFFFTKAIKRGSWLVEENYFRIFEENFSKGQSLALPSGESHTTFAYLSMYSLFERKDKFTLRISQCLKKYIFRNTRYIMEYRNEIFPNSAIKYAWFLSQISNMWIVGF